MKPTSPSGFFITFEGTEGAGKSTLMRAISAALAARGVAHTQTREPGGTGLAEKIRALILAGTPEDAMAPTTELFLYEAARSEHLARTITPALARGEVVLCDRFTDSTLAYQAHARGLPWKEVVIANRIATSGLKPNLTVWLDIDPAQGLSRAQDPNRFEAEGLAFQKKVRAGFARAMKADARRWLKLPARGKTPEYLAERVLAELDKRWKKRATKKRATKKSEGKSRG